MKRFFEWLFKAFRPDTTKYVKNMHHDVSEKSQETFAGVRKRKPGEPVLAWIPAIKILENKEDNQGVTVELGIKDGFAFRPIEMKDGIQVSSKKKGLSAVEHTIVFKAGTAPEELINLNSPDASFTFLYRNEDGEFLILGENEGLNRTKQEDGSFIFSGQEKDVFYRVSEDCFYTLLPNID